MTPNTAISVRGLGKRYRIGLEEQIHETLGGLLVSWLRSPLDNYRRLRRLSKFGEEDEQDIIWALRDVSFDVRRGETVGLIGGNGAGKSTLLKILSRVTDPTRGQALLNGRVSSLLEVGTGFHPELTGRENVYLNGTILGMKKAEIDRKFDEIVAFSEIARFIDTPVKRYSSGMRVRLAFAVAAHLEPEILLVDEVLAVGDASFQKKCVGKMNQVAKEGRTVVFVSHNMAMIQALCRRGVLLSGGEVICDAPVEEAVNEYMTMAVSRSQRVRLGEREDRDAAGVFRFNDVKLLNPETKQPLNVVLSGQPVEVRFSYESNAESDLSSVHIVCSFFDSVGSYVFSLASEFVTDPIVVSPGRGSMSCLVPKWPLRRGQYHYNLYAGDGRQNTLDYIKEAGFVDVELGDYYGKGLVRSVAPHQGVFVDFQWLTQPSLAVQS